MVDLLVFANVEMLDEGNGGRSSVGALELARRKGGSYHTNPTPSINWLNVRAPGCSPNRIASWTSGANNTSRRIRDA